MRIQTRKILLRTATAAAIACTAIVIVLPAMASAATFLVAGKLNTPEWPSLGPASSPSAAIPFPRPAGATP